MYRVPHPFFLLILLVGGVVLLGLQRLAPCLFGGE
jgi:hypothetical protein